MDSFTRESQVPKEQLQISYAHHLKDKFATGFKYSENPNNTKVLDLKRAEVEARLRFIDQKEKALSQLEREMAAVECTEEDMDRKVNSDAHWLELCAETLSKSEDLLKTI